MSISNNIDGSVGGGGQLLDFISLVTNPKVYEAKIKSLQEVTAEHQKFVELIAPATEILDLREKLKADKEKAKNALAEATLKAESTVSQAKDEAAKLVSNAKEKAAQLEADAQAAFDDAKLAQEEARKDANEVKKAIKEYDALIASLKAQQTQLATAQKDADAIKNEAQSLRDDLIAKHTAFIKSL